ncbi:MAG: glutamate-ammonia-ligase adenylyltransferase [Deltaproteobacteria bacterium]|nr:glutamate-ammonia-ligase adenylyltransferase [Deltaproteobacteria bacterium]
MKPSLAILKDGCPGVDEVLLQEHLTRLNDEYFASFDHEQVCSHLNGLARISPENPVEILLKLGEDDRVACTVLAFDYPGLFSIITGVLAGMGFNILSGDVFTYQRSTHRPFPKRRRTRVSRRPSTQDSLARRRIVDHFSGVIRTSLSFEIWQNAFKTSLANIISLLERGDNDSAAEAKHRVTEMVVERLAHLQIDSPPVLYPVQIEVDSQSGPFTRLKIVSEDTPAFLYALTNALSLHSVSIEHVLIRTVHGRIEDQIDLVDLQGNKIDDPAALNQIKLSVLLTKQFTYFLGTAPDPYTALRRFEFLLKDILQLPGSAQWLDLLSNPNTLQDLARLLGTSDYLWEDFIRLQYETLLPVLKPHVEGQQFSEPAETLPRRLKQVLTGATTLEEQCTRLNQFKDREIYLIDLDHILNPEIDFHQLAARLTSLAEQVVNTAAQITYDHLVARFGPPKTAAGLDATYAILGLGKLGGAALGYASDIEFILVYSDNGETAGPEVIANSEFFERMVKNFTQLIQAKREGIFHVDLRLRPHGSAGPLASSTEAFCSYYGTGGAAHSYERLALVRLRTIGGNPALGKRLERIRDEMIYASSNISLKELRELRQKQFQEKTAGGRLNAKFSPGGLVDLEYDVQILQVMYGKERPELRTPQVHHALTALAKAGVLNPEETGQLIAAYDFLRRLINSMRMLRGSAKDLFLPDTDSVEFAHLARRMGYVRGDALKPSQQLRIDYETHTAAVRAFVERHFGRASLPGPASGTMADLVLSDDISEDLSQQILSAAGFRDTRRAYVNLRDLAGSGSRRHTFAKLALLATDILSRTPDPDMALNNWERFIRALPSPEFHYNLLLAQPMRFELLLSILSGSQFLADTLIRNPGFLDWVIIPENLHQIRKREDIEQELGTAAEGSRSHGGWLNQLRRLRRREIMRIGTRDMYLRVPTQEITLELSILAEALIQAALTEVWARSEEEKKVPSNLGDFNNCFCILAYGKLGGRELNYSSDIDLLGIFDVPDSMTQALGLDPPVLKYIYGWVMEKVGLDLSMHTEEGYAYRVDLRLRPYGRAGELSYSLSGLLNYYGKAASLWEIQAALKIRPVAGNLELGNNFIEQLVPMLRQRRSRENVVQSIEKMRRAAIQKISPTGDIDVKSGVGGLRDVEFLVQGLQLLHAPDHSELLQGNTLIALEKLEQAGIISPHLSNQLREDYLFLRRVEHFLQILEDRQIHALPKDPPELDALAKRMLGIESNGSRFKEEVESCNKRVRKAYIEHLLEGKALEAESMEHGA